MKRDSRLDFDGEYRRNYDADTGIVKRNFHVVKSCKNFDSNSASNDNNA